MDDLWAHTQQPQLHEQWDLRFSEIHYLPKEQHQVEQAFMYRTRIGFGLNIAGTGITKAQCNQDTGDRLSALAFKSDQPLSLIHTGHGYWKYYQNNQSIKFLTRYDYKTRFGIVGSWFDALLFRPLFGYATAWSFDTLRLWLEKQIPPTVSIQRALLHYSCILLLAALWLFTGLVPKLLFPESGELAIMKSAGMGILPDGLERPLLYTLGAAEILLGAMVVFKHRSKLLHIAQIALLIILSAPVLYGDPQLLTLPFGPLPLTMAMMGLCLVALMTISDLPSASRCRRTPTNNKPRTTAACSDSSDKETIHSAAGIEGKVFQ